MDNTEDTINSRDIIDRIDDLTSDRDALVEDVETCRAELVEAQNQRVGDVDAHQALTSALAAMEAWSESDDGKELAILKALAEEGESSPDWLYGETLIRESYFTDYTEQLIDDCYELPKELTSGDWPYRHITVDYEAAANELKSDYMELDFDGVTYLIRA